MTIRVMIADDHVLIREGLKQLFKMTNDIHVIAEASNGDEVLEVLSKVSIDLLILDVVMPNTSGASLIKEILIFYPKLPILILTMHNEPQIARRKLNAGALGYITKDSDPEMLVSAVRKVASGRRFISHHLAEQLAFESNEKKPVLAHESLSKREFQVFLKLVNGQSVNDVAADLFLSNKTVSAHKIRLMEKMGIENNSKLIQYAVTHGFVN
ncbi:MAG TPA: response regulator transcription factor [Methylotenera sp.]|nr:response regulator transcription factor [Methylotenera sp.]